MSKLKLAKKLIEGSKKKEIQAQATFYIKEINIWKLL